MVKSRKNDWVTLFLIAFTWTCVAAPSVPTDSLEFGNLVDDSVADISKLASIAERISHQDTIVNVCDEKNSKNSDIYCHGKLLEAVNIHRVFNDSKTFVDMPMKWSPATTLNNFVARFGNLRSNEIPKERLTVFLNEYFFAPGTELEQCTPSDWSSKPTKLMAISDPALRAWALKLNDIWKNLCRKMKKDVTEDRHSLIYVPNEFIVPGGRFREFYYWDAYWIVKGLIASGMLETTRSMIRNFVSVIDRYGFVPNGGRVYYLQRSQPPMLIAMVYEYFEERHDVIFLREVLPALEKEFNFWKENRKISVEGQDLITYEVYQYRTKSNVPRPESFREDITHAQTIPDHLKPKFYQDIASAAESGWDFSTRWFKDSKTLKTIETTDVVPIDLNALLCWNMHILEYFFKTLGETSKSEIYRLMKERFRYAMKQVFYNETKGAWFDFNLRLKRHNTRFYAAVAVPLFAECYQPLNLAKSQKVFDFINKSGAFEFPTGVPATLIESGEQWDFPNGWSPLIHIIVEGLRKSNNPLAQEKSFQLAQKWVYGNYRVYQKTGHMWEKYNVIGSTPEPGVGGEYEAQEGFGWTNGVILDILTTYGKRLSISQLQSSGSNAKNNRETSDKTRFTFPKDRFIIVVKVVADHLVAAAGIIVIFLTALSFSAVFLVLYASRVCKHQSVFKFR